MNKKTTRIRRAKKTRAHIRDLNVPRLSVYRTSQHIYAQVIDSSGGKVLASASTLSKDLRSEIKYGGNVEAATAVGAAIAQKALAAGVDKVAFDRSGFKFHGRIKALAESARENGLQF
ncbi:MAG: 50S ribosomal protein L18 [Gammaproteobacteria bacterium]|nr:50S ribosomal protein L18 [Gammaproteobacteria bacterium]